MSIAFVEASAGTISAASVASLTTASFTIAAGTDKTLFGFAATYNGTPTTHTGMKWGGSGGTALTQIGSSYSAGANLVLSAWRLNAPAASTTTLYGNWGAAQSGNAIGGVTYTDVNQSAPAGAITGASGTLSNDFGADRTVTVTTVAGDVVLACFFVWDNNGSTPIMTPNGTPVATGRINATASTILTYVVQEVVASGTSTIVSCNISPTTSNMSGPWGAIAFVVGANAGAPSPSAVIVNSFGF